MKLYVLKKMAFHEANKSGVGELFELHVKLLSRVVIRVSPVKN